MDKSYRTEKYINHLGLKHQLVRLLWNIVWMFGAKWWPKSKGAPWKRFLLRLFGAKISCSAQIYSSAKIYYPRNLIMKEDSCIASGVDCYNVGLITIGNHTTVSQDVMLCTATHDIGSKSNKLVVRPIEIKDGAWIAAKSFVGPGVTIGEGAVVGACAVVFSDVQNMDIVIGNPARVLKRREIIKE